MLDVHPPHHAANTWRDFFIHIATIVVGLLIAVGIEQGVEHFHQREQVKQAREALDLERRKNIISSQIVAGILRRQQDAYSGTLAALQFLRVHPGTPLDRLPAPIVWVSNNAILDTVAWKTLQPSPIAALIPTSELQRDASLYRHIDRVNEAEDRMWDAVNQANRYEFTSANPSSLSAQQLDSVIAATENLLTENFEAANDLENLCRIEKGFGFTPCITRDELNTWKHYILGAKVGEVFGQAGRDYLVRRAASDEQLKKLRVELSALDKEEQ